MASKAAGIIGGFGAASGTVLAVLFAGATLGGSGYAFLRDRLQSEPRSPFFEEIRTNRLLVQDSQGRTVGWFTTSATDPPHVALGMGGADAGVPSIVMSTIVLEGQPMASLRMHDPSRPGGVVHLALQGARTSLSLRSGSLRSGGEPVERFSVSCGGPNDGRPIDYVRGAEKAHWPR